MRPIDASAGEPFTGACCGACCPYAADFVDGDCCCSCNYRLKENCYEINCLDCKREFWLEEVTDND